MCNNNNKTYVWIKEFNDDKVILTDGTNNYELVSDCHNIFDLDLIEDILDYTNRKIDK